MSSSESLRLGFEAADALLSETEDIYKAILDGIANPGKFSNACLIGLIVSIRTSNKEQLTFLLQNIPQTTDNYVFRSCITLELASVAQYRDPEVMDLLSQLSLSKLEQLAPPEILFWAFSAFIMIGIDKEPNLIAKASTLLNTFLSTKKTTNKNSYDQFMLEQILRVSSKELQLAFSSARYSRCLIKAQSIFECLITFNISSDSRYFNNSEFNIIANLAFEALVLQGFHYSKFKFMNFMRPILINKSMKSGLSQNLYSNVNRQLMGLVFQMCTGCIIPITDDILTFFSNLFNADQQKTAMKSLIEVNLINISYQFVNVKLSTLIILLQLDHHENDIDLFELILELKARKVLLVDIYETDQLLLFRHSKVEQKKLKEQVIYDLKHINISTLKNSMS